MQRSIQRPARLRLPLVFVSAAAFALAYVHTRAVDLPHFGARLELHRAIVAGTASSPYAYRVLVPGLTEPVFRAFLLATPEKPAFLAAYAVMNTLALWAFLLTAYFLFARWYDERTSLKGVLLLAVLLPVTFFDQQFQPWSIVEGAAVTAGLLVIAGGVQLWLVPLTFIACLNRETGLFIPAAALIIGSPGSRSRGVAFGLILFLIGALTILGVRWWVGPRPHIIDPAVLFELNLTQGWLLRSAVTWLVLLAGVSALALFGFSRSPRELRRAACLIPLYLVPIAAFGVWYEVRLLIPVLPILVGLALAEGRART